MSASEAERWLDYARSDLAAARTLVVSPDHYPRQVCFLAQQATEKALKAALIAEAIDFPFTHDLDRLRNLLPDKWAVKKAFPDLAEVTIWAVEVRYPADMPEVFGERRQARVISSWCGDSPCRGRSRRAPKNGFRPSLMHRPAPIRPFLAACTPLRHHSP